MAQKRTGLIVMATCVTFSALMTVQAVAQPSPGSALGGGGGGPGMMGNTFSNDSMFSDSGGSGFAGMGDGEMGANSEQGNGGSFDTAESGQDGSSDQTLPGLEPSSQQEGESSTQGEEPESPLAGNQNQDGGDEEQSLIAAGQEGQDGSQQDDGEQQPNRFDGGVTARQETRGEAFTPEEAGGDGGLAEVRNPSVFERHTVAEDHASVRTCIAAGEQCRAEFDVIAASEESEHDSAVLINDEQVLPPPDEEGEAENGEEVEENPLGQ